VIGVGGIGSFILGAARARGISRLIAVDIDDQRLKTARSIGADIVIDARTQDVEVAVLEATGGDGAHVVIEASGAPGAPETAIKATRRGGRVLIVGLQAAPTEVDLFALTTREVEITTAVAHVCDVDLPESLEIIAKGNLAQTVLDRIIPLDDLVEFGIRPLIEHTARGKIIVDPQAA
jgi:(R,R)-butanediol dehydrogenase/meso-butanediol dehydrogenase/diacetyl reductase